MEPIWSAPKGLLNRQAQGRSRISTEHRCPLPSESRPVPQDGCDLRWSSPNWIQDTLGSTDMEVAFFSTRLPSKIRARRSRLATLGIPELWGALIGTQEAPAAYTHNSASTVEYGTTAEKATLSQAAAYLPSRQHFCPSRAPPRRLSRLSNSQAGYAATPSSVVERQDLCWLPQPPSASLPLAVARPRWAVACCPKPSRATARVWAYGEDACRKSFRGSLTGPRRAGSCRLVRALASAGSQANDPGPPHGISAPRVNVAVQLTHLPTR